MNVARQRTMPAMLSLKKIEPTPVLVEPHSNGTHYFMLRVQGWDRVARRPT